jgi:hypothetical protein
MLSVIMLSVNMLIVTMLIVIMLSVIMLSVIMQSAIMLSVIMLCAIMLSVIMLSVVAPFKVIKSGIFYFPVPPGVAGLTPAALGWWGKCSTLVLLLLATGYITSKLRLQNCCLLICSYKTVLFCIDQLVVISLSVMKNIGSSAVVEQSPHNPRVKGLSPITAAGVGKEKWGKKVWLTLF